MTMAGMVVAYLNSGKMVVWGDMLAWPVSDLFLRSTRVMALDDEMFWILFIQGKLTSL